MITLEAVLLRLDGRIDRPTVETYIQRSWIRPFGDVGDWQFEEIDIARLYLVDHLHRDMSINEDGVDIVLDLLDQLYALRGRVELLQRGLEAQPDSRRQALHRLMTELSDYGPALDIE